MKAARKDLQTDLASAKTADLLFFENRLLGYKEAANFLCVSERKLRALKSEGRIKFVPIGEGARGIRFRVSSLLKFIEKREVSA